MAYVESEVDFEVTIEPECSVPVEGNVMVSGDEAADREAEQWVEGELVKGNTLAWCAITVSARLKTLPKDSLCRMARDYSMLLPDIAGHAHVGACSYRTEADMNADLVPDLKAEALVHLNAIVAHLRRTFGPGTETESQ